MRPKDRRPRPDRPRIGGLALVRAACLALALTGCALMEPTESGFLGDYSHLTRTTDRINWGAGLHRVEVRLPADGDLAGIDSFFIEPVAWLAPERDWMGPNRWRRDSVSGALDRALRKKLGQVLPVVAAPGPRTATVRAAVTDVVATRAVVNVLTSIVFAAVSNGGAAVEVEVRAPDGRQIAAVDGASMGGFLDFFGYYLWSSHSRIATRRLAGELQDALLSVDKTGR